MATAVSTAAEQGEPFSSTLDRVESAQANRSDSRLSLARVFTENRGRILATYGLFLVENLFRLVQPMALGWAINDLLSGELTGLFVLIGQHVGHLLVGLVRQVYDTRAFTAIYTDVVTRTIERQRQCGIDLSRISARAVLSREFVDFFEHSMPMLIRATFSIVGSLSLLLWYDWTIAAICLTLLLPSACLSRVYSKRTRRLSSGLHGQLEQEVDAIRSGDSERVREHFENVGWWRVQLSNAEAANFGMMESFVLATIVLVLLRTCELPDVKAGDIFAVFRYLMVMLIGLDQIPRLVQRLSKVRDIGARLRQG